MSSDLKTGQAELAKAQSYTKTSVFSLRFSPEWESVQRHVRRSIESLKTCGEEGYGDLLEAYKLSISAFEHTGSYLQCGTYSDERGDLLVKIAEGKPEGEARGLLVEAEHDYRQAAKYQRLHGNNEKNVTTLLKAAKCLAQAGETIKAIESAQAACTTYENDQRLIGAEKHLQEVLIMIITAGEWTRVGGWLQYTVKILDKRRDLYANSIYHCYLGEVVVLLYLQQYTEAFARLVAIEDKDDDFLRSEQRAGAKALIAACNSDNDEAIAKARKDWPILKYLQREIALLIPKLKLNPEYVGYNREGSDDEAECGKNDAITKKDQFVDTSDAVADGLL